MKENQGSSVGSGTDSKSAGGAGGAPEAPPVQKPEPSLGEFLKVQTQIATALEHWSTDTQRRMLGSVATVLGIRQAAAGQARREQQAPRTNQQSGGNQNNGGRRG